MVGQRSTGLPECGPTESSAPEPCLLLLLYQIILLVLFIHFSTSQLDSRYAQLILLSSEKDEIFYLDDLFKTSWNSIND